MAQATSPTDPTLTRVRSHTTTVLMIDDQPMVGEAVRRMLQDQEDIDFHFCTDAGEAIPLAKELEPTVILQDLVMPDADGLMLLRFYRANGATKEVPVIVLSSKEEPVVKAEAFALGASDYLVKLPDKIELVARIRHHSTGYIHLLQRNEAFAALQEANVRIEQERAKSERLLLNVLPQPIAERLKQGQGTIAESFPEATVLFGDICGFTEMSAQISPVALVDRLNQLFSAFDHQVEYFDLEKIKTIGDAYMACSGLPTPREDHAEAAAHFALSMLEEVKRINELVGSKLNIRIGMNSGPVVAGVIGRKKFIYDLWGDTVNTASRMESHGIPGSVQVSESTYELIKDRFSFEDRGEIKVKGKGEMKVYLLEGPLAASD
ncbi:Adenylate cyclase [Planctomycetes bacterium Pan216]|uniref:Adenylate cyclase n=1 Tax=Kolteria novifilia TaxID=2527975 RepID=A0A518B2E2_9BACT|nr:Adenylate cyclase [Planctomycetes bacterium Pan216]